jgi:hypothetical protein
MPGLHFHDLRHTFASRWMMNGGDLYVLKEILGHKSITMTQRYAHLSPAFKQAMVDRMEQMWAKPVETPVETAASSSEGSPRHRSVTMRATPVGEVVQNPLRTRVSQF